MLCDKCSLSLSIKADAINIVKQLFIATENKLLSWGKSLSFYHECNEYLSRASASSLSRTPWAFLFKVRLRWMGIVLNNVKHLFFLILKMKKKLFSSVLGIVVGVVLFGTIVKLTNNTSSSSDQDIKEVSIEEMRERFGQWSGNIAGSAGDISTWDRWGMPMIGDMTEQLWMSQEEIEEALSDGKTMRELMEENGVKTGWMIWPRGNNEWWPMRENEGLEPKNGNWATKWMSGDIAEIYSEVNTWNNG